LTWLVRNQNTVGGSNIFTADEDAIPASTAAGDIWFATDTEITYYALTHPATTIRTDGTQWTRQDIAKAINTIGATGGTKIDGGVINTQMIILHGGGSQPVLQSGAGVNIQTARIEMNGVEIAGYSSSGSSGNKQFSISSTTGQASFGGGAGVLNRNGLYLQAGTQNAGGAPTNDASFLYFRGASVTSSTDFSTSADGANGRYSLTNYLGTLYVFSTGMTALARAISPTVNSLFTLGTNLFGWKGLYLGDNTNTNNSTHPPKRLVFDDGVLKFGILGSEVAVSVDYSADQSYSGKIASSDTIKSTLGGDLTTASFWATAAPIQANKGLWFGNEIANSVPTPGSGYIRLYSAGDVLMYKNSSGQQTVLSGGGVTSVTPQNSITVSSSTGSVTIGHNSTPGGGHQHVLGYETGTGSAEEGQVMTISSGGHLIWADQSGSGGGSGDITGVNISAHTGLTGTVNTTSGQHTQTITHLDTNGFQHIPEDGLSGQVLTWDSDGTAEWTIPSAHGNHGGSGGSHDHSSSYSFSSNNISAVGNITVTGEYKGAAGSASSPTYTFTNDTDAGMWYGSGSGGTGVGISKGGSQILKLSNGAYITGYLNATVFPVGNEIDVSWSSSDNYIYKASSSRASKMNIRELDIDSSKLYDLELKSFDFRKSNMDTGGFLDEPGQASFGMIAEDVFPIMPNLVNLNKDGEPEAIQYKLLSVLLLAELKKLRTRIEVLEGNG